LAEGALAALDYELSVAYLLHTDGQTLCTVRAACYPKAQRIGVDARADCNLSFRYQKYYLLF